MSHPMWPACCGKLEKDCDCPYQHDIDDLLEIIKQLEERIINLEKEISNKVMPIVPNDSYYWEHG